MNMINRNNYEEFFLLYVDGELSAGDRIEVEKFVAANPDLLEELNLLKETVLVADNEIIFENKEDLYKEKSRKIIGFAWWRVAAAVILFMGAGVWGWKTLDKQEVVVKQIAVIDSPKIEITEIPEPKKAVVKAESPEGSPVKENTFVEAGSVPTKERRPRVSIETRMQQGRSLTLADPTETILDLPVDLTANSTDPPKENIVINIVPQKITEEPTQKENKIIKYEYVDPTEDDMIYVANTSVSKRNKFRGVFRKATRILDRVTSTN